MLFAKLLLLLLPGNRLYIATQNYPEDDEQTIPCRHQQAPDQDETADHTTDDEVERHRGNTAAEGSATGNDPKKHPMQTKGQTAQDPQPHIVKCSILHAGGFEDADEQQGDRCGQNTFYNEIFDCFASCHKA